MKLDIQRFALITVTASLSIDIEGLEEDLQRLEELKRKAEEKLEELKEKAKKAMEADKGLEQDILDLQKKYEEAKQLIEKKIEKIKKEIKKVQTQASLSVNNVKRTLGDALAEFGNRIINKANNPVKIPTIAEFNQNIKTNITNTINKLKTNFGILKQKLTPAKAQGTIGRLFKKCLENPNISTPYKVIAGEDPCDPTPAKLWLSPDYDKDKIAKSIKECSVTGKPLLYLYPTDDNTDITVTFEKPGLLLTTYPKYQDSWNVTANKNGDLFDKNGKYYYGLYWEDLYKPNEFKEGFYVTKDNAIDFLEEKLSYVGLNDRERNEFIMYWLPILERNKQSIVNFEFTEERDAYNKLNINPKPDSILRLLMNVKKVDAPVDIPEQELKTFNRTGFTAVEWGGTKE